jgi:ADP-heptose:LPS heptosyltransferase
MSIKKILIIRLSSIGDIIWTTPVVRCTKKQMQDIELHYCTKTQYKSLIESNPYIDKIFYLDKGLGSMIKLLKEEKYDFIIDLHKNIRSLLIKLKLGVRSASYNKIWIQRFLLNNFQINFMPNCHVVDRYMDTVKKLGVVNDHQGLDYFIPPHEEINIKSLPEYFQSGYVAYVIGGSAFTKILSYEKMIELCDKINRPIVLIGGKEDYVRGKQLEDFFGQSSTNSYIEEGLRKLNKKTQIYNGCGQYSIGQSASLVKQADYIIGHDTGLTHLAAAFKKIIYSIYGGTAPSNFYSYGTRFYILENNKLKCRPCSKLGRKKCPKGHFKCMKEISLDFSLPDQNYNPVL